MDLRFLWVMVVYDANLFTVGNLIKSELNVAL